MALFKFSNYGTKLYTFWYYYYYYWCCVNKVFYAAKGRLTVFFKVITRTLDNQDARGN